MNEVTNLIQVSNLSVKLRNKLILDDLNLNFATGKITAIIGPNGSGKSTLLKSLSGLIKPVTGTVRLSGQDISKIKPAERAQSLAFLMQSHPAPTDLTVFELVSFGRHCHYGWRGLGADDKNKIAWAIEQVGLTELSQRELGGLSGGQAQRAWIAMVLAQDTPLILLDEPTTFLDIRHQLEILTLLRQLNTQFHKTIIIVLHDIQQSLQFADNLLILKSGKIIEHRAINEKNDLSIFAQVFGVKVQAYSMRDQPDVISITSLT